MSTGSHPVTGRDCGSPYLVVFSLFYHEPYQPPRINKGGSPFRPPPSAKSLILTVLGLGLSPTTYLRVRICAYSPRTGIRSKCLQNPWGVPLTTEPNHLRRLQDAVGFFFFTTTNRQLPTGTIAVGFFFFTTTNQQTDRNAPGMGNFWLNKSAPPPYVVYTPLCMHVTIDKGRSCVAQPTHHTIQEDPVEGGAAAMDRLRLVEEAGAVEDMEERDLAAEWVVPTTGSATDKDRPPGFVPPPPPPTLSLYCLNEPVGHNLKIFYLCIRMHMHAYVYVCACMCV